MSGFCVKPLAGVESLVAAVTVERYTRHELAHAYLGHGGGPGNADAQHLAIEALLAEWAPPATDEPEPGP